MNTFKKTALNLVVTLLFAICYFYIALPPINLQAQEFYSFFFILALAYCAISLVTSGFFKTVQPTDKGFFFSYIKNQFKVPLVICVGLALIYIVGSLISSPILRASSYVELMEVTPAVFAEKVEEVSYRQIPMLDRDSAMRLGDRKLGELSDMVSQFEVTSDYTQINYQGHPVRVTPLEYGDFFKWLNNKNEGLPAYIILDMVTQNVDVVRLDEGMKYSQSEYFFRNIARRVRFQYPTFIFGTPMFEIDDEGNPYWIFPKHEKTIGLFGGLDANGAVLMNAITGESEYFEEVPGWVDRVYDAELIIQQYNYYGTYKNGFFNSLFAQKDVTITTTGYNYIAQGNDIYVYTGITSVGGDQSNVGFILTNQRTKQTNYYPSAGAEEYSAMSSAQGVVQHLGYKATFPILLNIASQPTYFIPLKDNAGLVKMFAMVNVQKYNIVATATTVAECELQYIKLLKQNNVANLSEVDSNAVTGVVEDIRSAVMNGTSYYYCKLVDQDFYYMIAATESDTIVLVNVGDIVSVRSDVTEEGMIQTALYLEIK